MRRLKIRLPRQALVHPNRTARPAISGSDPANPGHARAAVARSRGGRRARVARGRASRVRRGPTSRRGANPRGVAITARRNRNMNPNPRPKPVVPLTKAMKAGKAPLRTFGDLVQFYDLKRGKAEQEQTSQVKPPEGDPSVPTVETQATAAAAPVSSGPMPPISDGQGAMPPTTVEVPGEQAGHSPAQDEAAFGREESPPEMEPRPEPGHDEPTA